MAEKTCREFEENLDALLTGWYQEEDCTAERAAILNAYATAEQQVEELKKEVERLRKAADRAFRIVDHIVHGNGDELRRKGNS